MEERSKEGFSPRRHEQLGYAYDAGGNLAWRTNNNLKMQFKVNGMNQLTNVSRTGAMTVFGALASRTGSETVTVTGTGLSTTPADLYTDAAWASQGGATLADGLNTWTAKIVDYGVTNQQVVTAYMPASRNYGYDGNGNLTNDGLRSFEYDFENQLTNVYVASGWRSEFRYDGLGRRRVRREYTWSGGAWSLTNEVRYVYDGRLVIQERDGSNNQTVTYTRGLDLSGTFQGAGGIGGLLARSDSGGHAFYHSDANGNVVRLMKYSAGTWQIAAFYRYDPYGNILAMTGPLAAANLYRFSSKETHPNSGLVYYLYRYYDPNLQRWVNRDPIEEDGGVNVYAFVLNKANSLVDLFGLSPSKCDDGLPPENTKGMEPKKPRSHKYYDKKDALQNLEELEKAQRGNRAGIRSIGKAENLAKKLLRNAGRGASRLLGPIGIALTLYDIMDALDLLPEAPNVPTHADTPELCNQSGAA